MGINSPNNAPLTSVDWQYERKKEVQREVDRPYYRASIGMNAINNGLIKEVDGYWPNKECLTEGLHVEWYESNDECNWPKQR